MQDLRSYPLLGKQKVQQTIDEWLGSEDEEVPVCPATVTRVLRCPAVRLGAVAKDFEKVRPSAICHCLWALRGSSELSDVCMCSASTVKCMSVCDVFCHRKCKGGHPLSVLFHNVQSHVLHTALLLLEPTLLQVCLCGVMPV